MPTYYVRRRRHWFLRTVLFFWALYFGALVFSHFAATIVPVLVTAGIVGVVLWLVAAAFRG
ncbi:hypothetical protein [Frankia sp. AgKG'84/4]|uniref:hypothetical protein n=1 Tax=Frankia sp. AgKG'84/4 TaxID=573490 RepID=UPI002010540D|nr:hypothetical protein [Frankia sp. AgKG'84/4]MCL9795056.1 hypothetical protein [Frankia sp. AgKG'84/4]